MGAQRGRAFSTDATPTGEAAAGDASAALRRAGRQARRSVHNCKLAVNRGTHPQRATGRACESSMGREGRGGRLRASRSGEASAAAAGEASAGRCSFVRSTTAPHSAAASFLSGERISATMQALRLPHAAPLTAIRRQRATKHALWLLNAAPLTASRRQCARRVADARVRVARCSAEDTSARVSEPARAHVQALMAELAAGPASDGASAVRLLQTQLQTAQDALACLQEESSSTIQALRTVAERLSEEKLRTEAALAAKSRCELLACRRRAAFAAHPSRNREHEASVDAAAQHTQDLAAAQERYDAALREERARVRFAEALLAEVPTPEELAARQQAETSRAAAAVARVVELERELSSARDLFVSERVEQLVARVRALEAELAEQEGGAEELSALRANAAAAAKRVAELEAAGAAARTDRGAEVERLLAQNKALEQALQAQRSAVAAPTPVAVLVPAAAKQPAAAVYPDDIQSQLRRIEALLESLPVPASGGAAAVRA